MSGTPCLPQPSAEAQRRVRGALSLGAQGSPGPRQPAEQYWVSSTCQGPANAATAESQRLNNSAGPGILTPAGGQVLVAVFHLGSKANAPSTHEASPHPGGSHRLPPQAQTCSLNPAIPRAVPLPELPLPHGPHHQAFPIPPCT